MSKYIIALDQGTTSSRAVIFNETGDVVASHAIEFPQIYPKPGWVEHDPEDIYTSQVNALKFAVIKANIASDDILAIGVTNQRETTLVWEKETGKPLMNAIVWQCRRTAPWWSGSKKTASETPSGTEQVWFRTHIFPEPSFSGCWIRSREREKGPKRAN